MASGAVQTRPSIFPPLPQSCERTPNICKAYKILFEGYRLADQLLRLEDGDPIRLRLHSESLLNRHLPILQELCIHVQSYDWTVQAATAFGILVHDLEYAMETADAVYVHLPL